MAGTITVQVNQSMKDVVIQGTGSIEASMQFCSDNGVSITDVPVVGTVYVVSDAALAVAGSTGAAVLKEFAKKNTVIGTLGTNPPCNPPVVDPITGATDTFDEGSTLSLSDGTTGGVWSSSDATVATVDGAGLVTGVAAGTATISYTVTRDCGSSTTETYDITVNPHPPLAMTVMLKPILTPVMLSGTPPGTTGIYQFRLQADSGFVNVNSLISTYPSNNSVHYFTEADYLGAMGMGAPNTTVEVSGNPMTSIFTVGIFWHVAWYAHGASQMMCWWNDVGPLVTPIQFEDTSGFTAEVAPLIIMDTITNTAQGYLVGAVAVALVSSTGTTATLRLTRSHPAFPPSGPLNDYKNFTMAWTDDAIGGTADPADPTNANKTIVTVAAGSYKFGVETTYTNPVSHIDYPKSLATVAVEVS
jgi:Bacterial Ig-like domain (group 2)